MLTIGQLVRCNFQPTSRQVWDAPYDEKVPPIVGEIGVVLKKTERGDDTYHVLFPQQGNYIHQLHKDALGEVDDESPRD